VIQLIPWDDSYAMGGVEETGDRWLKRQVGIAVRLCIYDKRNNRKVTAKYFFYKKHTYFSLSFI